MCAEHKKPAKLLKHLAAVKAASEGLRNPPRMLVFANRIKVHPQPQHQLQHQPFCGSSHGSSCLLAAWCRRSLGPVC